jgi:hypothetical protein
MPIRVDLRNATGAQVHVDIVDRPGVVVGAESGRPGDGASVATDTLVVENVDARTLRLTWVDFPIDNALALYIDRDRDRLSIRPHPAGTQRRHGCDRIRSGDDPAVRGRHLGDRRRGLPPGRVRHGGLTVARRSVGDARAARPRPPPPVPARCLNQAAGDGHVLDADGGINKMQIRPGAAGRRAPGPLALSSPAPQA